MIKTLVSEGDVKLYSLTLTLTLTQRRYQDNVRPTAMCSSFLQRSRSCLYYAFSPQETLIMD